MSGGPVFVADISNGLELKAISFVNEIDDEFPSDVQYIIENVAGPGAKEDDFEAAFEGCICSKAESCGQTCLCVKRFGASYGNEGQICSDLLTQFGRPVIECSSLCTCPLSCSNRVVQKGHQFCLQVFKTKKKGFGVRTLDPISQFSFVCEYAGEVIGKEEAKNRIQAQDIKDSNYIFLLREHLNCDGVLETVVDPTYVGNVGRYLNHSCAPNLIMVPVRTNCMVPKLCLFAACDISPLEELCYNYSGFSCILEDNQNLFSNAVQVAPTATINRKHCCCESVACCGVLPFDPALLQ